MAVSPRAIGPVKRIRLRAPPSSRRVRRTSGASSSRPRPRPSPIQQLCSRLLERDQEVGGDRGGGVVGGARVLGHLEGPHLAGACREPSGDRAGHPPSSPRSRTGRRRARFARPGSSAAGEARRRRRPRRSRRRARRGWWRRSRGRRTEAAERRRQTGGRRRDLPVGDTEQGHFRAGEACVEHVVAAGETDGRARRRSPPWRSSVPLFRAPITASLENGGASAASAASVVDPVPVPSSEIPDG